MGRMNKSSVADILDSFGDEVDIQQFIQKILFVADVEKGLKNVQDEKVYDYEKAKLRSLDRLR
jgi:hypothetical protein